MLDDARTIFASVCADFGAELIEMDSEDDHLHLLMTYPPKVATSTLVNSLQRLIHPALVRRSWKGVLWSPGYFASPCGSALLGIICQDIEQQRTPD